MQDVDVTYDFSFFNQGTGSKISLVHNYIFNQLYKGLTYCANMLKTVHTLTHTHTRTHTYTHSYFPLTQTCINACTHISHTHTPHTYTFFTHQEEWAVGRRVRCRGSQVRWLLCPCLGAAAADLGRWENRQHVGLRVVCAYVCVCVHVCACVHVRVRVTT
jgi:hypothetical protein